MLLGIKWQEYFHWGKNKRPLTEQFIKYFEERQTCLNIPTTTAVKAKTHTILADGSSTPYKCNQEVDTRPIFEALQAKSDVVVVSKNTNVLILLIWLYIQFDIHSKLYMKFDHSSYIDISLIKRHFGSDISKNLLTMHEVTVWYYF